jgi:hypothetical protein
VLGGLALNLDGARERLRTLVAGGEAPVTGPIPFAPRAKQALVLSLRESLSRGDPDIGEEHILLAIARGDEESMAMRPLRAEGVVPDELRAALLAALPPHAATG